MKYPVTPAALPDLPCACATVRRAARLFTQLYGDHLRNHGLEASQIALLSILHNRPGRSQAVLARVLGFDKTTLSRNLKLLQKKGWVRSAPVEASRELGLFLTDAGQEIVKTTHPGWQKAQQQLQSAMSPAEWQLMWKAMRALTQAAYTARITQP
jgi:DNA-binding MarR family transcriptional regulator